MDEIKTRKLFVMPRAKKGLKKRYYSKEKQ